MTDETSTDFQKFILVHLDSAYNYAFWLCRNSHDAEDLVQEACKNAFSAFDRYRNANPRAWLFTIIRNIYLNQVQKRKSHGEVVYLDSSSHDLTTPVQLQNTSTPECELIKQTENQQLIKAIQSLPDEYREIIILRELEGLSYQEIADVIDCAPGTVMSRLSRARSRLKTHLQGTRLGREQSYEL